MHLHAFAEEAQAVLVVGLLLELQSAAIDHVIIELLRHSLAEVLEPRLELLVLDVLILFVLVPPREALPRQAAFHEVQEHVSDGLKVISSTLLLAFVRVEGCVAGGARQVLAVAIRNVRPISRFVVLGESKVYDVQVVFGVLLATD